MAKPKSPFDRTPDGPDGAMPEDETGAFETDPDGLKGRRDRSAMSDVDDESRIISSFDAIGDGVKSATAEQIFGGQSSQLPKMDRVAGSATEPMGGGSQPEAKTRKKKQEGLSLLDIRDRVVIKLLYEEVVRVEDVERAWTKWQEQSAQGTHKPLWRFLAEDGGLDAETVYAEAAKVYSFRTVQVSETELSDFLEQTGSLMSDEQWLQLAEMELAPVQLNDDGSADGPRIVFATHDPARPDLFRHIKDLGFRQFEIRYAPRPFVASIHETFSLTRDFGFSETDNLAFDLGSVGHQEEALDEEALDAEINRSALINLFERTLLEAVRKGASDIHIFPNGQRQTEIHMRINGQLNRWHTEGRVHPEALLAVVKDNSINVDRFERDKAQDGFIQRNIDGAVIRFRVSVMPIANQRMEIRSESIVIRVLDDRKVIRDLEKLGIGDLALERFRWAIQQPYGMVILTGPTGSGKTTTLYASLAQIISPKINVITVEDPVEYIIPEVRQVKLNHKFTLENALRAILRHDPDVVMVGEMRDRITADLAIKLANTGHLTFSTLHTNDAPSSVSRLFKMGIEPFLIAYAINLVVAQRLIRTLCPNCKMEAKFKSGDKKLKHIGFSAKEISSNTIFDAGDNTNCPKCRGAGYVGRKAITETLPFTPEIRDLIISSEGTVQESELREVASKQGMKSLADRAKELVLEGETSVPEMMRVVFTGL